MMVEVVPFRPHTPWVTMRRTSFGVSVFSVSLVSVFIDTSSVSGPSAVWENLMLYMVRMPPHAIASAFTPNTPPTIAVFAPTTLPYGTYTTIVANATTGSPTRARRMTPMESLHFAFTWPVTAASSDVALSSFGMVSG